MNLDRALAISDYQCDERTRELTWLAEQASQSSRIVEVGSFKGCTARALADNTPGIVYAVDTFKGSNENEMQREIAAHGPDWLLNTFLSNVSDLLASKIEPVISTSLEAAARFKHDGMTFDMIFLDAAHDYDSVRADILAWRDVLSPEGLLCGHDRQWDGVAQAINELLPVHRVGAGAIWFQPRRNYGV